MPLFSEHIANMYYGSSSPYTGSSYSYSSSASPLGSSYSASYLNPGGSYSNHSSLSSYSRAPLSSRWITSAGRNYSPMLTTITERGTSSPVRIHSPRRIPISSRTYGTPNYTPRPVNINTADIDVSRDRYRHKVEASTPARRPTPPAPPKPEPTQSKEDPNNDNESSPFMPRVDGKPETGIDSSPGIERSTIKRGRTVVRLYTIKRNSPRKPNEEAESSEVTQDQNDQEANEESKTDEKEFMKWREKLSDDLTYKDKKEKKTMGAKLVEKFHVKNDKDWETPNKIQKKEPGESQSLPVTPAPKTVPVENICLDRRCSMELLAEQANLLDSLIRSENLSTATLDLSKVGIAAESKNNLDTFQSNKRRKQDLQNPLKTTKSDHSLHDSLNSYKDVRDPRNFSKRRSIKKSSSGSSIRRLDSITEFPKEQASVELPAIEESRLSVKQDNTKLKPKLKTKITSSVEVIESPMSPLKFRVENVTVEEKPRVPKKEITYSSEVEILPKPAEKIPEFSKETNNIKKTTIKKNSGNDLESPEPEDGNFWNKIGKRETVYLVKRKQNLEEAREKNMRSLFWFPEEEEVDNSEENVDNNISQSKQTLNNGTSLTDANKGKETVENVPKVLSLNRSEEYIKDKLDSQQMKEFSDQKNFEQRGVKNYDIRKDFDICNESDFKDENVIKGVSELTTVATKEVEKDSSKSLQEYKLQDSETTSVKTSSISNECKSIGKSASMDALDENKVKNSSQKKTKSEKSKKVLKKDVKAELKPLQIALPKPSARTEVLKSPKKIEDTSTKSEKLVENKVSVESVHKIAEPVDESLKKEVQKPLQTPETQFAEQRTIESHTLEITDTAVAPSKDLSEVGLEQSEIINEQGPHDKEPISTITQSSEPLTSSNDASKTAEPTIITEVTEKQATAKSKTVNTGIKSSPKSKPVDKVISQITSQLPEVNKIDKGLNGPKVLSESKRPSKDTPPCTCNCSNNAVQKPVETKDPNSNKNLRAPAKCSPEAKFKVSPPAKHIVTKSDKTDDEALKTAVTPSTSAEIPTLSNNDTNSKPAGISANVPATPVVLQSQDIPKEKIEARVQIEQKTGEENKAENIIKKDEQPETSTQAVVTTPVIQKKPVKEEKAVRPLIATPRPLQKKAPQVIHSDSSESSSEEESSDEDDEDESDESEASAEFYECENNPDGRTSTGSNDSGFDSSAPASPATFSQIKKGGEASGTSSGTAPAQANNTDLLEQELEQSTAYDIFRKTGRFTPPARSIPRFRKYTVEDFQFIKVLGKGSFGKVLLAELRDTEYYYAVKCLKKDVVLEDDDVECTLIERKVLALGTNHPYLCHLFATFQTDSHLFFVMEYLNGGDLMFHIQQSGRFPEARARFYAAEIVSGLKFLHKRGIVYRDLKLDNILLDFEGHVRIADFGMCKLQIYLDKTADTFCGTPDYMAPEIIKGLKYNQTVDWWSFGVLLYEMLIGQSPFSGCDEDELFWSICNEMPSYPRFLSHEALTILTRLLDKDARTRLGGTECMHGDIREQDFFHAIHWDRLDRRELETPFRPRVRHPMDTQYFDKAFTGERPRLTAVEPHVLRSMDQEPFRGFSYTNPNTTDR